MAQGDVLTDEAATLLAAKLKTPLQIGQHLVRAFEAGFEIGAKPVDADMIEAVLSRQLDDLVPQLTRNGYDLRSLAEQFDAKPAEIRRLLRGDLDAARTVELMDEMRAAGLPDRLSHCASIISISRRSHRPCAQSQTACAGETLRSQLMCAENGVRLRVGLVIIARRYI